MTKIELTDEDVKLFMQFREHQDQFKQLLENKVFEHLIGEIVIHKDGLSIRVIETRVVKRFK